MPGEPIGKERAELAAETFARNIEASIGHPIAEDVRDLFKRHIRGVLQFLYLRDDNTIGHANIESILKQNAKDKVWQHANREARLQRQKSI